MSDRLERIIPWLLGFLLVCDGLRGVTPESFVFDSDAWRHALNGTLIYDFLRSGELTHPVAFAKAYYSRFPAISIPYHPPLFPMVEALSYAILGVNGFAARLPVAIASGLGAMLMYRLVKYTHRSTGLAVAATLGFFWLPICQLVARDVMLEMPSLALALGALYCLRDLGDGFPCSRAIPFAILASAAVWTKQHAVFLGLVPFAFIAFRGNWRLLKQPTLWAASVALGLAVLGLTRLSLPVKSLSATNQFAGSTTLFGAIWYNIIWYRREWSLLNGPTAGIAALVAIVAFAGIPRLRRRPESHLYLAWILSVAVLLLPLSHHDVRYLIYGLPAAFVLMFEGARLACSRIIPARYAAAACGALAAGWIAYHASLWYSPPSAPAIWKLARDIKQRNPRRLAYCGPHLHLHKLAMAMRFTNPDSRTIVIRGDKLEPTVFTPGEFDAFIHRYGVDLVVIEPGKRRVPFDPVERDWPWNELVTTPPASLVCAEVIPAMPPVNNEISVFAVKAPSVASESSIKSDITNGGFSLDINLD